MFMIKIFITLTPPFLYDNLVYTHTHVNKQTNGWIVCYISLLYTTNDCCCIDFFFLSLYYKLFALSSLSLRWFIPLIRPSPMLQLWERGGTLTISPGVCVCWWGRRWRWWHTHSLLSCHMGIQHLHSADNSYSGYISQKIMFIS